MQCIYLTMVYLLTVQCTWHHITVLCSNSCASAALQCIYAPVQHWSAHMSQCSTVVHTCASVALFSMLYPSIPNDVWCKRSRSINYLNFPWKAGLSHILPAILLLAVCFSPVHIFLIVTPHSVVCVCALPFQSYFVFKKKDCHLQLTSHYAVLVDSLLLDMLLCIRLLQLCTMI